MYTIVAVAVGEGFLTFPLRNNNDLKNSGVKKVRKYLHGLVAGLNRRGLRFGPDFVIDFRLTDDFSDPATFKDANGNNPHVIFCMSTAVVKQAANRLPGVPIVESSLTQRPKASK